MTNTAFDWQIDVFIVYFKYDNIACLRIINIFNNQLKKPPYSEEFLPKHITMDFFAPALEKTLDELAKDSAFDLPKSKEKSDNEEIDDVVLIEAWAIHSGCRIHTTVYEKEDEKEDLITEREILEKYASVIRQRLDSLRNEAQAESNRIEKENEKKVIDEIWKIICKSEVIKMNTQKARYEFADRIQILYQEEKGCDWLTKKQVRSLVEYRYTKLTE